MFGRYVTLLRFCVIVPAALWFALGAGAALAQVARADPVTSTAEQIVENFRRLIVLHDVAARAHVTTQAGQYLFFRNRELVLQLVESLLQVPREESGQRITVLLDLLATRKDWRDVDRLALLGVVNETRAHLPAGDPLESRLDKAREEIMAIRTTYSREFADALAERPPAARKRPAWDAYVAFLREQYPPARIMDELMPALPAAEQQATPSPKGPAFVNNALRDEWTDGELPPRTVLLTFDDGPHPRYTAEILLILAHYGIKAIFFQVGQNLGVIRDGRAEVSRNAALVADILRMGHAIANHTYTHPVLPKLGLTQVDDEIDMTQSLLIAAAPGPAHAPLFRPPYGARNALVLGEVADRGLRSVVWNIDSRDWADPIPRSIAQRVVDEAEHEGRGIVLFHDIHSRTVEALPIAITELIKRGFRFAHWEGTRLTVDGMK